MVFDVIVGLEWNDVDSCLEDVFQNYSFDFHNGLQMDMNQYGSIMVCKSIWTKQIAIGSLLINVFLYC